MTKDEFRSLRLDYCKAILAGIAYVVIIDKMADQFRIPRLV